MVALFTWLGGMTGGLFFMAGVAACLSLFIMFLIFGIIGLIAGIFSIQRKYWAMALIGSIILIIGGLLLVIGTVLAVLGLIFVILAKDEFE
jgi:hypothetical protein